MVSLRRQPIQVCRRYDAVAGVFLVGLAAGTKALSQGTLGMLEGHKKAMWLQIY